MISDNTWNKSMGSLSVGDQLLVERNKKVVPCTITFVNKGPMVSYKVKYPGNVEEDGVSPSRFCKRGGLVLSSIDVVFAVLRACAARALIRLSP